MVSDAAVNSNQRFPLIAVVPLTGTPAPDQVRSIDKQRIRRRYGRVSAAELEAIDNGLVSPALSRRAQPASARDQRDR